MKYFCLWSITIVTDNSHFWGSFLSNPSWCSRTHFWLSILWCSIIKHTPVACLNSLQHRATHNLLILHFISATPCEYSPFKTQNWAQSHSRPSSSVITCTILETVTHAQLPGRDTDQHNTATFYAGMEYKILHFKENTRTGTRTQSENNPLKRGILLTDTLTLTNYQKFFQFWWKLVETCFLLHDHFLLILAWSVLVWWCHPSWAWKQVNFVEPIW